MLADRIIVSTVLGGKVMVNNKLSVAVLPICEVYIFSQFDVPLHVALFGLFSFPHIFQEEKVDRSLEEVYTPLYVAL